MYNDKISIVIPAYNLENYIEKTLSSVCAQTYRNLEIIVVDDGSVDSTLSVLQRLAEKDERIKVIYQENGGVTKARFTGVAAATGQWIGFVDGDDFLDPEMYEVLITNAKKHGAQISHCGYKMVYPSKTVYYYNTERLVEQDNKAGLMDLLKGSFVEPGLWNKLYHKSLLDDLISDGTVDYSVKITEDLLINYFLFKKSKKSVYFDKCFYHYVLRKGSAATSKINENKIKDPLKVLRIIKEDSKDNAELQHLVNARLSAKLIYVATLRAKSNPQLIKPYRKAARRELKELLPVILKGKYGIKKKMFMLWVSLWPSSYAFVHSLYARITGSDKKYEVK